MHGPRRTTLHLSPEGETVPALSGLNIWVARVVVISAAAGALDHDSHLPTLLTLMPPPNPQDYLAALLCEPQDATFEIGVGKR